MKLPALTPPDVTMLSTLGNLPVALVVEVRFASYIHMYPGWDNAVIILS